MADQTIAGVMADEATPPTPDLDLSDDLLDKYLDGGDTGEGGEGRSATKGKAPVAGRKGTRQEEDDDPDLDDDTDDSGVDDDEDEELDALLDEDEEDEEDADPEEDPEEEQPDFLSKFNRQKFLEKYKDNPDVMSAYRSLQAGYTRAMQGFKQQEREWSGKLEKAGQMESQFKSFHQQLSSDEGMTEFLVNVALNRPKVFESAFEEAASLSEDEGRREQYLKDQNLKEREKRLTSKEKETERQQVLTRISAIESLTHRAAKKLGLVDDAQIEIAEQFVANALHDARARTGKADITDADVVAAVKSAAKRLGVTREQAKKQAERERRKREREAVKGKARDARRPQPPRGKAPVGAPAKKQEKSQIIGFEDDPLDSHIDSFFGL